MSYWVREVAGWLLIVFGLWAFYQCYDLLLRKRIIEAFPMAFVGFIIFRGGIHLLKVAVAAQAARGVLAEVSTPARKVRPTARPIGPTPAQRVLPGPQNPPRRREEPAVRTGRD
jgi:hypothetical protein